MLRPTTRLILRQPTLLSVRPRLLPSPALQHPILRALHQTPARWDSPFSLEPSPGPQVTGVSGLPEGKEEKEDKRGKREKLIDALANNPAFAAVVSTLLGLSVIFACGGIYMAWYKWSILNKMEVAFQKGYDPALELANLADHVGPEASSTHIARPEQPIIRQIMRGECPGRYFLILGSKGVGKATMMLDAMREIDADRIAVCEAHPDLEVFRLRVGKALNYEFLEDFYGALFQRREPRDAGPLLDIERAMSKLEKVAMRIQQKTGHPIVFVFNNMHLFPNDETGAAVIHQLQHRAEAWAESGIATFVFSSDDFWVFEKMKKNANRLSVVSVYDLPRADSIGALARFRASRFGAADPLLAAPDKGASVLEQVYSIVGGRLSHLSHVARELDPLAAAQRLKEREKAWLLARIGLIGGDMDDDVMDEQKWSSCSWLLLRNLARQRIPGDADSAETDTDADAEAQDGGGEDAGPPLEADPERVPHVSYYKARQLMTRTDFLEPLDHANIIAIDVSHDVRTDSHLLLTACREVVSEEGFDELLEETRDRIDEIEWLNRTREITVHGLIKHAEEEAEKGGGKGKLTLEVRI